jgi:hypothetical protein
MHGVETGGMVGGPVRIIESVQWREQLRALIENRRPCCGPDTTGSTPSTDTISQAETDFVEVI